MTTAITLLNGLNGDRVMMGFKAIMSVVLYAAAMYFVSLYVRLGFEFVNFIPSNQAKILLWTTIAVVCFLIASGTLLFILRFTLGEQKRSDAHLSAFVLTFYAVTSMSFLGLFAYAVTEFVTGPMMIALVAFCTVGFIAVLWLTIGQAVKCWQGAKLP